LTKIKVEARLTARETGRKVTLDALELPKPTMKVFIELLNGGGPLSRTTLYVFEPIKKVLKVQKDGTTTSLWKVKRYRGQKN
jgi:hypothetical protein